MSIGKSALPLARCSCHVPPMIVSGSGRHGEARERHERGTREARERHERGAREEWESQERDRSKMREEPGRKEKKDENGEGRMD